MPRVGDELLLLFHARQDGPDHPAGKQNHKQENRKPANQRNGGRDAEHHGKRSPLAGCIQKKDQAFRAELFDLIFVRAGLSGGVRDERGILRRFLRADRRDLLHVNIQNLAVPIHMDDKKAGGLERIHVHRRQKWFGSG